ncbi:Leucine-rich repeats and immunoglobulin-like domains protein 3, partial [Dissostichus eleginoides]
MCPPPQASPAGCAVFLLLVAGLQAAAGAPSGCPPPCVCVGELVDCSRLRRGQIPRTLPEWTVQL